MESAQKFSLLPPLTEIETPTAFDWVTRNFILTYRNIEKIIAGFLRMKLMLTLLAELLIETCCIVTSCHLTYHVLFVLLYILGLLITFGYVPTRQAIKIIINKFSQG